MDLCGMDERQTAEVLAELLRHQHVHLVVGEPERHLRDLGRELLYLDAVELIDINLHKLEDIRDAAVPCHAQRGGFRVRAVAIPCTR